MDLTDMQALWQSYDAKLNESLQLNKKLLTEINVGKTQGALRRFSWGKIGLMLFNLVILFFAGKTISLGWSTTILYFMACFVFILTAVSFFWNLKHLVEVLRLDYGQNILVIQKQLQQIRVSTLRYNRFIFLVCYPYFMLATFVVLQLPFWEVVKEIYANAPHVVIINLVIAILWFPIAIGIIRHYERSDLRSPFWKQLRSDSALTEDTADRSLIAALGFLKEIKTFEKAE